jgi:hypothetical protein
MPIPENKSGTDQIAACNLVVAHKWNIDFEHEWDIFVAVHE